MEFNLTFFQVASIITAICAFGAAAWLYRWVTVQPSSNKRIAEIGLLIRNGAYTFLKKEYKTLLRFCSVAALVIFILLPQPIWNGDILGNFLMAVAYICGTIFSGIAGVIGISISTIANVKSAEASTNPLATLWRSYNQPAAGRGYPDRDQRAVP
jgi:K(+)-stimulated pyrophosphate-energized sodium pump